MSQLLNKDGAKLSAIVVKTKKIGLSVKHSDISAAFLSCLPSHEISRATPYVDVTLIVERSSETLKTDPLSAPSIYRFLNVDKNNNKSGIAYNKVISEILSKKVATEDKQNPKREFVSQGMELFQSSQIMVNADKDYDATNEIDVVDKFRPFLSLKSLSFNQTTAAGLHCYRSGNMALTLHDRSRLPLVADFLKPANFSRMHFLIEYGWSHPDPSSPFGKLIDNMRVREIYQSQTPEFSFTQDGQVDINLKLFMQAEDQVLNGFLGDDTIVNSLISLINDASSNIKKEEAKVKAQAANTGRDKKDEGDADGLRKSLANYDFFEDPRSLLGQIIGSRNGNTEEFGKHIEKMERSNKVSKPIIDKLKELKKKIDAKLNNDSPGLKTQDDELFEKIQSILDSNSEENDPFLHDDFKDSAKKYISFGKFMMATMGWSLQQSGFYKDIQFLFYPMNNGCIRKGNTEKEYLTKYNISSFRMNKDYIKKLLNQIKQKRGITNMRMSELTSIIINNFFLNDVVAIDYGIYDQSVYAKDNLEVDKEGFSLKSKEKVKIPDVKYPESFKRPAIEFFYEATPFSFAQTTGIPSEIKFDRNLRIHITDSSAGSYEIHNDILSLFTEGSLAVDPAKRKDDEDNKVITLMTDLGILEKKDDRLIPKTGGVRRLSAFLSSLMPTLIYGSSSSGILSLNVKNNSDSAAVTIHAIRADTHSDFYGSTGPEFGMPIYVLQTTLDVDAIGCPVLQYGQLFYLDAGTGTTIDGIYRIVDVSHEISKDAIKTKFKGVDLATYGQFISIKKLTDQKLS